LAFLRIFLLIVVGRTAYNGVSIDVDGDVGFRGNGIHAGVSMESKEPKIRVEYGTEVSIVTFDDENILEEPQIKRLEQALLPVVQENEERKLILNFENVRFMSSAFLGLLVKVHKRVIEMGGHLQLFNLDPKIQKVFEITQLTKVFDIA
jgi:anti-sigma B factor antagonist